MKLKPQRFALLVISYQPAARSCDDDENPCFARCSVSHARKTGRPAPNYRWFYRQVLDGKLAAERDAGGRYRVDLDDAIELVDSARPAAA
jgi:hypothetical protein